MSQAGWTTVIDVQDEGTTQVVDFRLIDTQRDPLPMRPMRDSHGNLLIMSRKTLKSRMRRKLAQKRYARKVPPEFEKIYKPIEEWDAQELARGRPRASDGTFKGKAPAWITREVHEESMTRFRQLVRDGANGATLDAIEIIQKILNDNRKDRRGRPVVPASTKLDAAKFLVEHVLGKPTQRTETDISVKLQGILASAVITPGTYKLPAGHDTKALTSPRDIIDVEVYDDDDE